MEERIEVLVRSAHSYVEWDALNPGMYITTNYPRAEEDWKYAPIIRVLGVAADPDGGGFEEHGLRFATAVVETGFGEDLPLTGVVLEDGRRICLDGIVAVGQDMARRVLSGAADEALGKRRREAEMRYR